MSKITITEKNYLTKKLQPKRYACGNNLYFEVISETNRSWKFRWQVGGKPFVKGLGAAKLLTPGEAKQKAIYLKKNILAHGVPDDPTEGGSSIVRMKFFPFADDWRNRMKKGLRHPKSQQKLDNIVDNHLKPLHDMWLDEIETADVVTCLDKIWHLREMSRDVRQQLKRILTSAKTKRHRKGDNPADWEEALQDNMPKQPKRGSVRGNHKGAEHADLPTLFGRLTAIEDDSARAIEVCILCIVRSKDIFEMEWDHIDLKTGLWSVAGAQTKNECVRRTPLPRQVLGILRARHAERLNSRFVFPGRDLVSPISNNTMLKRIKEITGDPKMTMHGMRGTFRSWTQDTKTGFDKETIEHCLHHITGDAAEIAYKHGEALEKRRELMQMFADHAYRMVEKDDAAARLHIAA